VLPQEEAESATALSRSQVPACASHIHASSSTPPLRIHAVLRSLHKREHNCRATNASYWDETFKHGLTVAGVERAGVGRGGGEGGGEGWGGGGGAGDHSEALRLSDQKADDIKAQLSGMCSWVYIAKLTELK
jgi:hypothetical protein